LHFLYLRPQQQRVRVEVIAQVGLQLRVGAVAHQADTGQSNVVALADEDNRLKIMQIYDLVGLDYNEAAQFVKDRRSHGTLNLISLPLAQNDVFALLRQTPHYACLPSLGAINEKYLALLLLWSAQKK
jgi:hypothetical protein